MVATYDDAGDTYEDTDFLWEGLDPALAMSVLIGNRSAAEDLTADVDWDTFVATDNGTNGRSLVNFRLNRSLTSLTTVTDQALVKVVNHALHTESHRAFVRSRKPVGKPMYDATDIIADDIGGLLDDTFIPIEIRPGETMVARITALWFFYRPDFLDDALTFVVSIGGTLPEQTFAGVTLRQAIEATISQASSSADYYVDALGRLHIFTSETNPAPFNIDADAPTGGEVAPETLDIEYESNSYANEVYIQGGTPEGSGWFSDVVAIAAASGLVRQAVVQAPDCTTAAMATALSNMYLGRVKSGVPRGMFRITDVDGWQAGQNVLVTDAAKGLSAQNFRIRKVTTRVVRPGATPARRYDVEFGGSSAGGSPMGSISENLGSGQLVYGNLGGQSNVYITSEGVTVTDST